MESNRGTNRLLIGCVIVILLFGATTLGFVAGRFTSPNLSAQQSSTTTPANSTEALFKPFWEAWKIVHDEYLVQPVDDEKMMQGAIRGMMDSLGDPHSGYMDPVEFGDATAPLEGYSGIGA